MQSHPLTLPAFGALIPGQSGHFAAIMRGNLIDGVEQPPYALLAAPAATEIENVIWGKYGQDIIGATSRRDGQVNTAAMVVADCPAALCVRNLAIDGHADWYLPALGELNAAAANVPELFNTKGWYWTSTQYSRDTAFVQDFEDGGSGWDGKDFDCRVRAFRRIPLDLLTS
jgi:hypothetical protein